LAPKSTGHVRPDFVRVLTGIRQMRTSVIFFNFSLAALAQPCHLGNADDYLKRGKDLAKDITEDWIQIFTPKEAATAPGGT